MTKLENSETKSLKLTITMPKGMIEDLDRYCKAWDYDRSEAIREAVRRFIK